MLKYPVEEKCALPNEKKVLTNEDELSQLKERKASKEKANDLERLGFLVTHTKSGNSLHTDIYLELVRTHIKLKNYKNARYFFEKVRDPSHSSSHKEKEVNALSDELDKLDPSGFWLCNIL